METVNETYASCSHCNRQIACANSITCPECCSILYCSEHCRLANLKNVMNPDHAHEVWCNLIKIFMRSAETVSNFPFTYAQITTKSDFSLAKLLQFLRSYGVFNLGLWKYMFHTCGNGPGEELREWQGIIFDVSNLNHEGTVSSIYPQLQISSEEMSLLCAYSSPSDAILISIPPILTCQSKPGHPLLLSVELKDWMAYYSWRGFSLSSPLAFLFHWPLTIYFILHQLLPCLDEHMAVSIASQRSLTIHLLGVESEVDLLPVFKELEYLISPDVEHISLVFVGPNISLYANRKVWRFSPRFTASIWRGMYHDFVLETLAAGDLANPDVIIGFNVGLTAYDTWAKTLELLANQEVPVFFTDYCQYSCLSGMKVLRSLNLWSGGEERDPLSNLILNPFRSPIRQSSAGVKWPLFSNSFIFSPFVCLSLASKMINLKL